MEATGREAERMLQHLMKRGGEDGLEDALSVCHVIGGKEEQDVEQMYLEHLVVEKEDAREAIGFLKKAFSKCMEKNARFLYNTTKSVFEVNSRRTEITSDRKTRLTMVLKISDF